MLNKSLGLATLDWELGTALTSGLSIGDHTFENQNGYFIYLETSNSRPGEEVW